MRRADAALGGSPRDGPDYDTGFSEPDKTFTQVLQAVKWSKPFLKSKIQEDPNPGVDEEVLGRTEKEVKEGKASGPCAGG